MSFVAVALGGTALNMGGSIFGGLFGSGAEKRRAATIREAGLQGSRDILKSVTDANLKADEYLNIGVQAGQTLANMLMGGGNLASLLKSSDLFNFQSEIGSRNINRELAARGLYGSGAGLETLARFNNQLVAEEGQRFTDRLLNLTQLGANTANSMAGFTSNTGNSIAGRIYTGGVEAANMRYNSAVGAAQAQSNATQMLGQMGQNIFGAASQGLGQFGNFALNKPMIDSSIAANNALAARYAPQSMGMTNDDY
jgi:hypothetical protein